ncbi:hypothetical protein [Novosphingobium sp. P6W]|uniref:hypothetical protein n=1 Tax=Novosphingobium sp. P6W TaxID=1609758 RepID=UPI0005C3171D|nr:hypothetical protein [Novosphingobium sp. P6W]AXB75822.1 hypothetical protein TQ38_004240 [Novosphingobium sp. P6W]KIS32969.1 hypothetical protein TQ38_05645 [Novosphingobium sp. P6W]
MGKFTKIIAPALAVLLGAATLAPSIAEAAPRHHDQRGYYDQRGHHDRRARYHRPVHHARHTPPRHVKHHRRADSHHVVHRRAAAYDRHHR